MPTTFTTRTYGPYTLRLVWPKPPREDQQDAIDFWRSYEAITDDASTGAEQRAQQLVVIARETDSGSIAAVSTATKKLIPQLGFPCFSYRTFVGSEHRKLWALSEQIINLSYDGLNERFQRDCDPDTLGIFIEVQNPRLLHLTQATWKLDNFDAVYIGQTPNGHHLRVCYFKRARIQ